MDHNLKNTIERILISSQVQDGAVAANLQPRNNAALQLGH
jgi:hypothetical protein